MIQATPVIQTMRSPSPRLQQWMHDLDLAREVQARMLRRKTPLSRTLQIAGCYLPARVLGGDYCDLLELGPGRVGLALGDISGKGVSAALMMASLQGLLRSRCDGGIDGLPVLLHCVNRLFCENTGASSFATLFLGEYEDSTGRLRYVNCGHPPALLVRPEGNAEWLNATALPLGILEEWEATEGEVRMETGDMLVLYTDGLTESSNEADAEFGAGRLLEAAIRFHSRSVRAAADSILAAARSFCGGKLKDDATLFVARRGDACPAPEPNCGGLVV